MELVVIAVIAVLRGHDAMARLEPAVPALADHALSREAAIVIALRDREIMTRGAFVWVRRVGVALGNIPPGSIKFGDPVT